MDDGVKQCGTCVMCVRTHLGCECGLTDNTVEPTQDACIDHIAEEDPDYEYYEI